MLDGHWQSVCVCMFVFGSVIMKLVVWTTTCLLFWPAPPSRLVCVCLVQQSWYLLFELQHVFLFWTAPTPPGFNLSMTTVCMCFVWFNNHDTCCLNYSMFFLFWTAPTPPGFNLSMTTVCMCFVWFCNHDTCCWNYSMFFCSELPPPLQVSILAWKLIPRKWKETCWKTIPKWKSKKKLHFFSQNETIIFKNQTITIKEHRFGVIFSRTEMDGILCSERIPPQFLVSISEEGQVLWSRAESNLEPSSWTGAESASAPKSKAVTLTARDDANDDPMDDTSTGRPDAKSTDDDAATAPMQVDQPPARTRRVYIAPKYCEPFMGSCPLCQVEYVSGQVTCTTCGYEPLPVDESGDTKEADKPNRRTRILERRMQSLAGFGMFGEMSGSLLTALTDEQANLLRRELGPRGITSVESAVLKDCRDRHRRAKALGYEDVEDRYSSDVTFCDRIHGEGKDLQDCIFDDMFAYGNLPDPPRTKAQISAGVAANAQNENCLSKLIFMSQPRGVDGFPVEFRKTWKKVWGFMFGPPHFYRGWICQLHRSSWRIPWPFDLEGHCPSSFWWHSWIPRKGVWGKSSIGSGKPWTQREAERRCKGWRSWRS